MELFVSEPCDVIRAAKNPTPPISMCDLVTIHVSSVYLKAIRTKLIDTELDK